MKETLDIRSIKSLYSLALAEGEGVGTAYEYYVKRMLVTLFLNTVRRPSKILVAGLPEKFGSSLDFLLISAELRAQITIADERPWALKKLSRSVERAQSQGWIRDLYWEPLPVSDLSILTEVVEKYDLILSSEVLQRIGLQERTKHLERLSEQSNLICIFTPNADNPSHQKHSGLGGLSLSELRITFTNANRSANLGYIDMPPFPPGITRSESQRDRASSGRVEALLMWGLMVFARFERVIPNQIMRRRSHIVFALSKGAVEESGAAVGSV